MCVAADSPTSSLFLPLLCLHVGLSLRSDPNAVCCAPLQAAIFAAGVKGMMTSAELCEQARVWSADLPY